MLLIGKILVLVIALGIGFSWGVQTVPAQEEKGKADSDSAAAKQRQEMREQMADRWKKLRAFAGRDGKTVEVDPVLVPRQVSVLG